MPVVRLTLIEGYDDETRQRLAANLTDAVMAAIAAPLEGVTVAIEEVKATSYMRGRQARLPGKPLPAPIATVRAFLDAMEARDLDRARSYLADDFSMIFPGGAEFRALEDLVEWSRSRYRFVRKTHEGFDQCFGEAGVTVYCFGTLTGEFPDGRPFERVRFIDRFVVRGGRIAEQKVWNDLRPGTAEGAA